MYQQTDKGVRAGECNNKLSAKLQLQPRARSPCFSCIKPEGQAESGFTGPALRALQQFRVLMKM